MKSYLLAGTAMISLSSGTALGALEFTTVMSEADGAASVTGMTVGEGGHMALVGTQVYYRAAGPGATLQTIDSAQGQWVTLSGNGIVTYTVDNAVYQYKVPAAELTQLYDGPATIQSIPFQTNAAGSVAFITLGSTESENVLRVRGQATVDAVVTTYHHPLLGTAATYLNASGDAYYTSQDGNGARWVQKHNGTAVLTPAGLNPTFVQGVSDNHVLYLADGESPAPGLYLQDLTLNTTTRLAESDQAGGSMNDLGQAVAVDLTDQTKTEVNFWTGSSLKKLSDDFDLFEDDADGGQLFTITTTTLNNSGLVLFSGQYTNTGIGAVLLWNPANGTVETVAQAGSPIMVDGGPMTIVNPNITEPFGSLYRDSFSDDGFIALTVMNELGEASVVLTQVPEPALGLLGVASLVLLKRRR